MLEFRLLGPVEVSDGGQPIALRHRERALLALLALRPGEAMSTDRLVDGLWGPRPPKTVGAALHNAVSLARKAVGADVLVTRPPGYALEIDPERVDSLRFARLVEEARGAAAPAARVRPIREALGLWRGRPLADVADEPFAALESSRLEELWLAAREDLVEAEIALGRHAEVLGDAEALVADQPFSERARALQMVALYRSGRQAQALDAYAATRAFLRDELGLDPSPALRKLQAAVLRQDPALDPPHAEPALPVGEERRKTVSVVFADVVGSTALAAELDPEAYRAVLRRWYRAARAVLEAHGGTVEKFIGDAVVAVFGFPRQHEDDAARAVRAAVELGERLEDVNAELEVAHGIRIEIRTGVNTGEAIAGDAESTQSFATGYAVNVAAKLQQSAPAGGVLIGPATYALVRDAVEAEAVEPLALGRRGASVTPYLVGALDPRAAAIARRLDAPLVGRDDELATLRAAFAGALSEQRARVVTVVGDAGIGKSRLSAELAVCVRDQATVVVGRCVSYGNGATYLPVAELVMQLARSRSEARVAALLPRADDARLVARRLRQLLGWAEGAPPPGEGFWAVRRLLEARAAERPLLVVLDDVHWAEPTLLDLVEHLAEHAGDVPLVVLCLARPDLLEARPGWPVSLTLGPLPDEHSEQLVEAGEGGAAVSREARSRIVALAEGNALFAEQLLAHVLERGEDALEAMPSSVEGLLASRLDLLPEQERAVLERAAVLGREFWRGALEALAERDVSAQLAALSERRLIGPADSLLAGEDAYRFDHVLIRDVAYAGATKERRSVLHERAAAWLEEREPGWDEIIGYHLEQAHLLRAEVAPGDEALSRIARTAGIRLADAGLAAWKGLDAPATVNLLGRATQLLPDGGRRAGALIELAIALDAVGDADRRDVIRAEALRCAAAGGSTAHEWWARLETAAGGLFAGDGGDPDSFLALVSSALPVLEERGDDRMLARAWVRTASAHSIRLQTAAWADAAARAAAYYRRAGWPPAAAVIGTAAAVMYGPAPVPDAISACEELLAAAEDRSSRAGVLIALGVLEAMAAQFAAADQHTREAAMLWEELKLRSVLASTWDPCAAEVARLRGDYAEATDLLSRGCRALTELRDYTYLATRAAELGHVLLDGGDVEDAAASARLAQEHLAPYDTYSVILATSLEARLLARRPRRADAGRLARRALAVAEGTDSPTIQAQTALHTAEVLFRAGNEGEAERLTARATALFEAKGNVVDAARARERLSNVATEA